MIAHMRAGTAIKLCAFFMPVRVCVLGGGAWGGGHFGSFSLPLFIKCLSVHTHTQSTAVHSHASPRQMSLFALIQQWCGEHFVSG